MCTNRNPRRAFTFFRVTVACKTAIAFKDVIEIPCAIRFARHHTFVIVCAFDVFWSAFGRLACRTLIVAAIGAEIKRFRGLCTFGCAMVHRRRLTVSAKTEIGIGCTIGWYGQQTFFARFVANRLIRRTFLGVAPRLIIETGFKMVIVGTLEITDNADFRDTFFFAVAANRLIHRTNGILPHTVSITATIFV